MPPRPSPLTESILSKSTVGRSVGDALRDRGVGGEKPRAGGNPWAGNLTRLKRGDRGFAGAANKTESEYGEYLDSLKAAGAVLWWRFKPCTLRLSATPDEAKGACKTYSPDFEVVYPDRVEFHEVKGHMTDAAWVTLRMAAEVFPHYGFAKVTKRAKKDGGGFSIERL